MALHNDVFQQQIWDFFCNDLESCLTVSKLKQSNPNSPFKGGLNFTATLAIFSVIELAAGWWKGTEATNDIIASFIQNYLAKYYDRFNNKSFAKKFYEVFRNGLSHQWSPKASGVAMDFYKSWLVEKTSTNGQEEILLLNVPTFYYVTKQGLEDFEKDINTNEAMRKMFERRYSKIVDSDYKEMRILRGMLESQNE
ncbi:MAG TPA: hypothetical protein VE090_03395 [Methylomirabilota bacterium]|nr:hypothetical protein [Methylomirabilota bacterium]